MTPFTFEDRQSHFGSSASRSGCCSRKTPSVNWTAHVQKSRTEEGGILSPAPTFCVWAIQLELSRPALTKNRSTRRRDAKRGHTNICRSRDFKRGPLFLAYLYPSSADPEHKRNETTSDATTTAVTVAGLELLHVEAGQAIELGMMRT